MPWTSIGWAEVATASKLITSVDSTPDSCTSTPVTWVSVLTGITSPARGPEPMVRVSCGRLAAPITAETGPSRVTSAWM